MRPLISNVFTISTHSDNALRVLERDAEGNPTKVGVDLYCNQSIREDDDHAFQSYSTVFFGNDAARFVRFFEPGDKVRVDGTLRLEVGEYTDARIRDANWQFPRMGNGGQQSGQQQNQTASQPQGDGQPQAPQPTQPAGQQASGNPQGQNAGGGQPPSTPSPSPPAPSPTNRS